MEKSVEAKSVVVSGLVLSSSVNVEGLFVGELSPIKTSRNHTNVKYFESQLSDGCKTVTFVSFEPNLHSIINEAREELRGISFGIVQLNGAGKVERSISI